MKTPDTIDADRLETAVAAYQEQLFRFAALRTGSRADAEDIVQEAFLRFAAAELTALPAGIAWTDLRTTPAGTLLTGIGAKPAAELILRAMTA